MEDRGLLGADPEFFGIGKLPFLIHTELDAAGLDLRDRFPIDLGADPILAHLHHTCIAPAVLQPLLHGAGVVVPWQAVDCFEGANVIVKGPHEPHHVTPIRKHHMLGHSP